MQNENLNTQFNQLFLVVVGIAILAGVLYFFANIFPWWYINKKGKQAGLDDFTISQWRWRALWLGWITLIPFLKLLRQKDKNKTNP